MATGRRVLYEFGPFRVDPDKQLLLRENHPVVITPKAFETLLALIRHSREVVSKEELMKAVWPDAFVEEANLSQNIFVIRKALGETPEDRRYIVTIPGRGYRFASDVRTVTDDGEPLVIASRSRSQVVIEQAEIVLPETLPALSQVPHRKVAWKYLWPIGSALGLLILGAAFFLLRRQPAPLGEKDFVLIANFTNTTGDPVFDDTLRQGLEVQLQQSPFLNVISHARAQQTLKLMGRPQDTRITSEIGREICQRDGLKAVIAGSIARLGSAYVITLEAVDGSTGDTLAETQAQASRKEQVLNALDIAATELRAKLGESLNSIQKFDTPLAQATTSSLTALKAFTLGDSVFFGGDELKSVPFYEHAVELDPNFVLAYARLGTIYSNYGQQELMERYEKRAFALRDRASERERLYVTAHYYKDSGQIEKGIEAWELYKQTYPQDHNPWVNLAAQYILLGQFHKALENARQAVRLAPDSWNSYGDCAIAYAGLNRLDEAKAVLDDALKHKLVLRFSICFSRRLPLPKVTMSSGNVKMR